MSDQRSGPRPPSRVRRRLARSLPSHLAGEVLEELDARYRERVSRDGRLRADLWYRRQARGVGTGRRERVLGQVGDGLRDLRLGVRKLLRRPVVGAALIGSLALGIGANAAIFSVVNRVLLQPLPYEEPDGLRLLHTELPLQGSSSPRTSGPEIVDLADVSSLESFGGAWFRPGALTDDFAEPEEIGMAFVTAGFLPTLGVQPERGRWPSADEDRAGGEAVIVLANHLWERRYGGDPDIVGRRIDFDGEPHTVVGVMPESFRMLLPPEVGMPAVVDAWVPFGGSYEEYPRDWRIFSVVARLGPASDDATAAAELDAVAGQLRADHPEYAGSGLAWRLEPMAEGVVGHVRTLLTVLLGAVGLMLLIVCANCVNLAAAGMGEGRHELAVRAALGAGRGRLLRLLAAESAVVVAAGAAAGLLLANWGLGALLALAPEGLPRLNEVRLDGSVLAFTFVVSAATVLLLGVASAARMRSAGRWLSTRGTGADQVSGGLLRGGLVVFQVAVCLMLMIGVGLLVQSFASLTRTDVGFEPDGLDTVKISLVDANYGYREPGPIADFYGRLERRLAASAGVEAVGATTRLPFDGSGINRVPYSYETEDGPIDWGGRSADYRVITPGFLEAIGARLVAGRDFEPTDDLEGPLVVIVDDRLAERVWPDGSAIGRRLLVERFIDGERPREWAEVVGVVEHLRQQPDRLGIEQIFQAHGQVPMRTMTLAIRSPSDPQSLLRTVGAAVREIDAEQPTQPVVPMSVYVGDSIAPTRFAMTLLGLFAAIAMTLALVGTYGVISYSVSRRTRELGIQMALGATPRQVLAAVLGSGVRLSAAGLVVGVAGALLLSRSLSGLLHGVGAIDPLTYAIVAALLGAVALGACWLPARRAARLDPVEALRTE